MDVMGGSDTANQKGTYGTRGKASPNNVPGARGDSVGWIDPTGNLWLFGGFTFVLNGPNELFNDLWNYSAGEWTWIGGSNAAGQSGTYGTQGTASVGNIPGARQDALRWTDTAGNFWLFGGNGLDSVATNGQLNDLWVYSAGTWTWVAGSNVANQPGTYGTQGMAAPGNVPGARSGSTSWTDAAGNLWLFGGATSSTITPQWANDLWMYRP